MEFVVNFVKWFRKKRTEYLWPLGKFFVRLKIKPLYLTAVALILGVIAVYFLFRNNLYFVILGVLHLIFDGLDGVVARAGKETKFGAHLDNLSDRLIIVLVLIKSYFFFNDFSIMVILWIYLLHHIIFILSDLKGKVAYSRMAALVLYFFGFYTFGYFLVAVVSAYGLYQQLNDFLKKKLTT